MKNLFFICFVYSILFFCSVSYSQELKGIIKNQEGDTLFYTNLLIKQASSPTKIKEFAIASKGTYSILLKKEYDTLLIEAKSMGYISQTKSIITPEKGLTYKIDFVLKEDTTLLKEIIIRRNKRFEEKGDTIAYNVDAYKDGSERKVEDLLKKLPGVEVDDKTGKIKYKGKEVETVTLEGDNLFGRNYTLGTRNINIDIVEQVEAIENYNENPLLKEVDNGEKVALNLKLKKGKVDFSGELETGIGLFDTKKVATILTTNILSITKNYKSFSTFSYNNIGVNYTPFDYLGFSMNYEELQENEYLANRVLSETRFSSFLDDRLINVNNQLFGNYNATFRIKKRLSIKSNLYFVNDKISNQQLVLNTYSFNTDTLTTSDDTFIEKNPIQYRGDLELKYNTSKNSLLEYKLKVRKETISTPTTILLNNTIPYNSKLLSKEFYVNQQLLFTQKLSKKKVIQYSILNTYNDLPQLYTLLPSISELSLLDSLYQEDSVFYKKSVQESNFTKRFSEVKITLLGARNDDRYMLEVGAVSNQNPYYSILSNQGDFDKKIISTNNFDYRIHKLYNLGAFHFKYKKWKLSPSYSFIYLYQKVDFKGEEALLKDKQTIIFEPSFSLNYKINNISSIMAQVGYNQQPNNERNLFLNPVLMNNRTISNNIPSLEFQKMLTYRIHYYKINLYKQFNMELGIDYTEINGNFFSNFFILPTLTQTQEFFLAENSSTLNSNFSIQKYIDKISSSVKFDCRYSLSNYKNIVNNSQLRDNRSQHIFMMLFYKTAFNFVLNFENNINWNYNSTKTYLTKDTNAFNNHAIQNKSSLIIKPSDKWFGMISYDYFLPSTGNKQSKYAFLSTRVKYNPKNKKWKYELSVNNILNIKNFEQIQITDFSETLFRSSILSRHFLIQASYSF